MYSLKELQTKVGQIFASQNFGGTPRGLYEPISYTLALGGKRIRPTMLLAATDLFGADIEQAHHAAIGIELFHNFTLLHDDLMDRSPVRRGQPTVYRRWNENTAILSGDAMHILAWQQFIKQPHKNLQAILQTFGKTCIEIHEGQQLDMDFEQRNDVTLDEYMEMIRLKTAVLLGGALKIGALYADASPADTERLYNFGIMTGLAFQLRDDLLDAYGDTATFGKQTGTDIKDNKKSALLLIALQKADAKQKERLQQLFASTPQQPDAKIAEVLDIYSQLDIRSDVEQRIAELHNKAMSHLDTVEVDEERKQPLRQLACQLQGRNI